MSLLAELKSLIGHIIIHYPDTPLGWKLRYKYWKRVHQNNLGHTIQINRGAKIGLKGMVEIGHNFMLGEYATLAAGDSKPLFIGNHVSIAKNAYIRTANHEFSSKDIPIAEQGHTYQTVFFQNKEYSIVIEDDVWIGVNAVLLSGAHIGKGSIIGAGSVVSGPIPPYSIVSGNLAKLIAFRP